jgi:hypothetical protein
MLLMLPMSRHGTSGLVLCVEASGVVNVETARGEDCGSSAAEEQPRSESRSAVAELKENGEHCVDCTDVPLSLRSTTEPCESAVLMAPPSEVLAAGDVASVARNLEEGDRHAARTHSSPIRRASASPASVHRQEAHLFSDTSIVRAKSSVELLI